MFKEWLKKRLRTWLGIDALAKTVALDWERNTAALVQLTKELFQREEEIAALKSDLAQLRLDHEAWKADTICIKRDVAELFVRHYVPPSQPEPQPKIIKTQTFKQFTDILEHELEEQENNAIR